MFEMNLENKKFIPVENRNGLSSNETNFHYFPNGAVITGNIKVEQFRRDLLLGSE